MGWLGFCEWVLSHPDREDGGRGDQSRESPSWYTSRLAVCDFVEACVSEDVDAPISAREKLANLLTMLCTQFDWRLDKGKPVHPVGDMFQAINSTRSRALENLVEFGFWLRGHDKEADISTVTSIIGQRFSTNERYPLSLPERAMLGVCYQNIFLLDEEWSIQHKSNFFPRDDLSKWRVSFCNLLEYCNPFKRLFEVLYDDFEFALQHLDELKKHELGKAWIDRLGIHLVTYYLWEIPSSTEKRPLLYRYYDKTNDDRAHWEELFNYVGRSLQSIKGDLDSNLEKRFKQFFEWRLEKRDPVELQDFRSWLESECLDAEWRLGAYSRVLDVRGDHKLQTEGLSYRHKYRHELRSLVALLPKHSAKVVECLAKLTDNLSGQYIYLPTEDVQTILKAGLESDDQDVRAHARRAQNNLLRSGYSSVNIE